MAIQTRDSDEFQGNTESIVPISLCMGTVMKGQYSGISSRHLY